MCVWLTCYGVHGLSAVVGALWGALAGGEPPCGAASEVHVRPAGSRTPQPASRVKHPPHMPHPTGLIVKLVVKEHIKSIMVLQFIIFFISDAIFYASNLQNVKTLWKMPHS